jgi:hypothetical protein
MRNAKEFLDLCTRRFPPPRKDLRHTLSVEDNTLVLSLIRSDYTCQRFNLDGEDLNKHAGQLLSELIVVAKPTKKSKPPQPKAPPPDSTA